MGEHVHETASVHIDTDGHVEDAETPEEALQRLIEALSDEDIDVEIETKEVNE